MQTIRKIQTPFGSIYLVDSCPIDQININFICLHGEGKSSNWSRWEPIMEPLYNLGYRVISFDMPGYGNSTGNKEEGKTNMPSIIYLICKQLNIKNVILIGSSEGGRLAFYSAIKHNSLVKGIIATHPVAPSVDILQQVKCPVLLTWSIDDRWGQPFNGPHGCQWFQKQLKCEAVVWKEADFGNPIDFYRTLYVEKVNKFLKDRIIKSNIKSKSRLEGVSQEQSMIQEQKQSEVIQVQEQIQEINEKNILNEEIYQEQQPQNFIEEKPQQQKFNQSSNNFNQHNRTNQFQQKKQISNQQQLSSNNTSESPKQVFKTRIIQASQSPQKIKSRQYEQNRSMSTKKLKKNIDLQNEIQLIQEEDESQPDLIDLFIDTTYGKIHILHLPAKQQTQETHFILAIHGDGATSNNKHWIFVMQPLSDLNHSIYSISMPGYGLSTGKKSSFRNYSVQIIKELIEKLNIQKNIVLLGRSVGGRVAMISAVELGRLIDKIILVHPVVPQEAIIRQITQPIFLSWAEDDGYFDRLQGYVYYGHPFNGPHGASYIQKITNCEFLYWREQDYQSIQQFYQSLFVKRVNKFLIGKQKK